MAKLVYGDRIGKTGRLALACNGILFDAARARVLLTRRADNGQWCLPGGFMEAGESVAEACEREVLEETGLRVRAAQLVGVYSTPHRAVEYADGNRYHLITLAFACEVEGGEAGLSHETTGLGWFSPAEIETLDVMEHHRERIADAFVGQAVAVIK
jgi:ADP-ribose pyrophosphatase YjhB (NUDIX family)